MLAATVKVNLFDYLIKTIKRQIIVDYTLGSPKQYINAFLPIQ